MKDNKQDAESQEEALKKLRAKHDELMAKYGFVTHCVPYDSGWVNYHTHGLEESVNHMDFQIVLPLGMPTANYIFHTLNNRIKSGEVFHDGDQVTEIIEKFPIRLAKTESDGRLVLRVIFPDKNGLFSDDDQCDELYAKQVTVKFE